MKIRLLWRINFLRNCVMTRHQIEKWCFDLTIFLSRVTTEPGYRIKIYFFLCSIPESLYCQRLYLNVVDDEYSRRGSTEDVNRNRICGTCPETIVTLSNKMSIMLQSDASEEMEQNRRFALRLEKTLGMLSTQHIQPTQLWNMTLLYDQFQPMNG